MPQNELIIYEGSMCCPTGVCGPAPAKALIEFRDTTIRLQTIYKGRLTILRANLAFSTFLFIQNKQILDLVNENGEAILPITTLNGEILATRRYLKFDELNDILEKKVNYENRYDGV